MKPYYEDSKAGIVIYHGDAVNVLASMSESSVDSIVTDPPYGLRFMGQDWDCPGGTGDFPMRRTVAANTVNTGASRQGGRQRGCEDWQKRQNREMREYQDWTCEWAAACIRVAKPGAFMLAFGGTRTHHRLVCGIEDAGWEIRDCIMWVYGSGFPKSHDISKAIDKSAGAERERIRGVRSGVVGDTYAQDSWSKEFKDSVLSAEAVTDEARHWSGWGTALKPAWEPIIVAMKPIDGTFEENARKHGVAGMNVDGCRVGTEGEIIHTPQSNPSNRTGVVGTDLGFTRGTKEEFREAQRLSIERANSLGRWPANLIHDGSDEVLECFPDAPGQQADLSYTAPSEATNNVYGRMRRENEESARRRYTERGGTNFAVKPGQRRLDSGPAARFFYCAKASRAERGEFNNHPTVKPIALMRWLCKLTATPTGGVVLDPFCGSGTTGVAAVLEGRKFIGVEMSESYADICLQRLKNPAKFVVPPEKTGIKPLAGQMKLFQ